MSRPTRVPPVPAVLGVLGLLLVLLVTAGGRSWWPFSPDGSDPPTSTPATTPATPAPIAASASPTAPAPAPRCPAAPARPFAPTSISVAGVPGRLDVIAPPRDANGIPGVPPLSGGGKNVFAYDREQGIAPGAEQGNVLLNAHTWPDGTALGNALLRTLDRGDRIVVRGTSSKLCYRVTEKVEVAAAQGLPRYYATTGRPQLAIVVCSGRRLGPGNWENRTIWFASPTV